MAGWHSAPRVAALAAALLVWIAAAAPHAFSATPAPPRPALVPSAEKQLGLIEHFYQAGAPFRAESEVLRFLYAFPGHPRREEVELLRAKLYYREGRVAESRLMLISLLDRYPAGTAAPQAQKLLGFSYVRAGLLEEARPYLATGGAAGGQTPGLEPLGLPPQGFVAPERAQSWSTWLPGAGFFLLSQSGKGWAALSLNLFFTGAALASAQNELYGPALIFLLVESALYRGGREAARQAAEARNTALRLRQTNQWLHERGEPELLKAGLTFSIRFP